MKNKNIAQTNSKKSITSAAAVLFAELGFFGVSMSAIAKKINLSKPALYYHFKNKKELYLATAENSFKRFILQLNRDRAKKTKTPKEKLLDLSCRYLKLGLKDKNFLKFSFQNYFIKKDHFLFKQLAQLKKETIKNFEKIIEELYKERKIFKKNKLKKETAFLVGALDGLIANKRFFQKEIKIKELNSQIKKIVSLI